MTGLLTLPVEEAACTARSRLEFSVDLRVCSSGQTTLNAQLAYWTNQVHTDSWHWVKQHPLDLHTGTSDLCADDVNCCWLAELSQELPETFLSVGWKVILSWNRKANCADM